MKHIQIIIALTAITLSMTTHVPVSLGNHCCPHHKSKDTAKKKQLKVCFVAGKASHGKGKHAHDAGLQYFADLLNKHMPEIKTAIHKGGWPTDPSFFDGATAIVIYTDGGKKHVVMDNLDQVDALHAKGIGIGCIHYGVEVPKGDPGNRMLNWTGGYFETHWSVNPHWIAEFKSIPEHEVTRGVKPFTMKDEWYFHMRFRDNMKGVTPVLSAIPPMETIERKDGPHSNNPTVRDEVTKRLPQHLAWVSTTENGTRGFGITGGHVHLGWKEDNLRKLVLNMIVWLAGGEVPKNGVPSKTPTDKELDAYLK
ncbi:hypothetical protein BVX97_01370 [bacterium E08(2017)]|nr:hypothetical protein BVX97_01370 [bacterium E08(2017)]